MRRVVEWIEVQLRRLESDISDREEKLSESKLRVVELEEELREMREEVDGFRGVEERLR